MIRHNYKKLYGITLEEAKEICKQIIGRLPRCGYSVLVKDDLVSITTPPKLTWPPQPAWTANHRRQIRLYNISGTYSLDHWISPFSKSWEDNFCKRS